jgi:hypothetical protein
MAADASSASISPLSLLGGLVDGGVSDVYGESSATEDQSVTPWTRNVAWYASLDLTSLRIHSAAQTPQEREMEGRKRQEDDGIPPSLSVM